MKQLTVSVALALLLTGCGGRQEKVSVNNSQIPAATQEVETRSVETPKPTLTSTPATKEAERPVEFTYLGLTPDKQHIHYKIKVNTEKPLSQVDLGIKYMDETGKVLDETTLAWQNIIKSKRMPIERGKTYDVEDYLAPGSIGAEVTLKRAVFEDSTCWKAEEE